MTKKFKQKKRKITSEEKLEKRKKFLFSLFLAGIMLISVFSISLYYVGEGRYRFEGHTFSLEQDGQNTYLVTRINRQKIPFYTQPEISSMLKGDGNLTRFFDEAEYFMFTSNPYNNLSMNLDYIRYEFNTLTNKKMMGGVDDLYEGYDEDSVITCDDANYNVKVIHFIESNETSFNLEGNCLKFNVEPREILQVRDRMMLSVFKIINK